MKPVKNHFPIFSQGSEVVGNMTLRESCLRVFLPACICSASWQRRSSFGQSHSTLTRLLRAVQRRQLKEQTTWKFSNYSNGLRFWNGSWNTITWIKGYKAIKYDSKFRVWIQDFVWFWSCTLSSEMHSRVNKKHRNTDHSFHLLGPCTLPSWFISYS